MEAGPRNGGPSSELDCDNRVCSGNVVLLMVQNNIDEEKAFADKRVSKKMGGFSVESWGKLKCYASRHFHSTRIMNPIVEQAATHR